METFYTIIKIASNPISGDSLSIGLLLRDRNRFWVHFSEEKKSIARRLLDGRNDTLDFIVKQIEQKIAELNKAQANPQKSFFGLDDLLTSERFAHLSVYCNGLLSFTPPSFLNDFITEEKFIKLFTLLVDKTYQKTRVATDSKDQHLSETIYSKLISRVHDKVHTDLELTPERLPGLYYNFSIDCIGLNGAFIAAKVIPFHKRNETIDKELSHYLGLISILNLQYKGRKGRDSFYIVGDEPTEVGSKEHKTWENIKLNPAVSLIYSDESDKVADEIESRKARTFIGV